MIKILTSRVLAFGRKLFGLSVSPDANTLLGIVSFSVRDVIPNYDEIVKEYLSKQNYEISCSEPHKHS